MSIDLDGLQAAAEAATPGNWHWSGNTDIGEPYLATRLPGAGRCQVVGIGYEERSTTGKAADQVRADAAEFDLGDPDELVRQWAHDSFGQPVREPRLQFMTDLMCVDARNLAVYEVAPNATSREDPGVYRADVAGIRHPDAEFIAAANPAVVLELVAAHRAALARIAQAEVLHDTGTIYGLTNDYLPDESRPILDYCAECTADSTISMIEDCEWDADCPVVVWPCPTVRALVEGETDGG